jgi:hypothetical protein
MQSTRKSNGWVWGRLAVPEKFDQKQISNDFKDSTPRFEREANQSVTREVAI